MRCPSLLLRYYGGSAGFKATASGVLFKRGLYSNPILERSDFDQFHRNDWWNPFGPLAALHSMNYIRIPWIRSTLISTSLKQNDPIGANSALDPVPLKGKSILDIGCGGGILSEPLARLGAHVIGIDESTEAIEIARSHAAQDPNIMGALRYQSTALKDLAPSNEESGNIASTMRFDAVIASEVLEHVNDWKEFLGECSERLNSGGLIFITTLNKTMASKVLGIWAAEEILRIVPSGIHDWEKFISPADLQIRLDMLGFHTALIHGMCYNPFWNTWSWSGSTMINYALHAVKL